MVAADVDGKTVFDDRLFGNQRHGLRLVAAVPALARQLDILDASGDLLSRVALPLTQPVVALDR